LRIYGIRKGPHYFIPATFICEHHEILKHLNFMVDNGATVTTLCAERLNAELFNSLPNGDEMTTANGPLVPKVITHQPMLAFRTSTGKLCVEQLDRADVCHLPDSPFDGLLGMDVQLRFRVSYGAGRDRIVLQR
jgi:hypothetical protein